MKLKNIAILFSLFTVLPSCITTHKTTYWVDSVKLNCEIAAAKEECLRVYKGEDLSKAEWQIFDNTIEGFEFEAGYLKKIQVKVKSLKKKEVLENGSAIKYILVKEMEKQRDDKGLVNGEWILSQMNNKELESSIILPKLKISLEDLIISGKGGCNNYSASITSLSTNKLVFGPIMSTRMACDNNNIESEYLQLLNTTTSYEITDGNLILFNNTGEKILSFNKTHTKVNQRLHDIWYASRIDNAPIKRLVAKPRLEINLTNLEVYGFDGCNEFGGNIKKIDTTKIELGAINSTLKACDEMNVSEEFNAALSKVDTYQLKGLNLFLYDVDGHEVLSFFKGD